MPREAESAQSERRKRAIDAVQEEFDERGLGEADLIVDVILDESGYPEALRGAVVIDDAAEERACRALCADEAWEDDWMIAKNVVGIVIEALRGSHGR